MLDRHSGHTVGKQLLKMSVMVCKCWNWIQAIAEEANGDNVLIVTHGDGVNASVTRIWPWALSHPVLHTGFTIAARDKEEGMFLCNGCVVALFIKSSCLLDVRALQYWHSCLENTAEFTTYALLHAYCILTGFPDDSDQTVVLQFCHW